MPSLLQKNPGFGVKLPPCFIEVSDEFTSRARAKAGVRGEGRSRLSVFDECGAYGAVVQGHIRKRRCTLGFFENGYILHHCTFSTTTLHVGVSLLISNWLFVARFYGVYQSSS